MSKFSRLYGWIAIALVAFYIVWKFAPAGAGHAEETGIHALHALGAALAGIAVIRAYLNDRDAKYWLYYGIGIVCVFAAKAYWSLSSMAGVSAFASPGPFEVVWFLQYAGYAFALYYQNRCRKERSVPYLLDILLLVCVTVSVYWQLFISPIAMENGFVSGITALDFACSALTLAILIGLLLLFTFDKTRLGRTATLLLIAGFFAKAAGTVVSLRLLSTGNETGGWTAVPELCLLGGILLIGMSAVRDGRQAANAARKEDKDPWIKRYIPLALGVLLLLLMLGDAYPLSPVAFGSLLGVALLTARLFAGIRHTESVNRALRESNRNFANWVDNSLAGVFIEQDGKLVYVNRHCEVIFGYEPGRMTGQSMFHHIEFPDVARFLEETDKLANNRSTSRFSVTGVKSDQSQLYLEMQLAATSYHGRPALAGTLIDITEHKMSEQWLIRSEKLSVVGQLAAGVAHEIRNPLTALKGFTQLLYRNADENRKYYEIMLTELERINYIVGEFMVLSKPHNRQQLKEHDIHRILTSIIPILESQAILHNVMIRVEPVDNLPFVQCDENQIKQVLINLMKNAIESMPEGGTVDVRYESDVSKRQLTVYIEDQGVGMPAELVERLGEPFLTTKEKGTGLGLMVCYKIIQAHEGILSVISQPGQGTTVKLVLPSRQTNLTE